MCGKPWFVKKKKKEDPVLNQFRTADEDIRSATELMTVWEFTSKLAVMSDEEFERTVNKRVE